MIGGARGGVKFVGVVGSKPMRALISGASGLVGRAVAERLTTRGDMVVPLVRRKEVPGAFWDPKSGAFDRDAAEGADAVVHLAGENVASGRWTPQRRAEIRDSRVLGTRHLAEGLRSLERRPAVMVAASAIGFYGNSGDVIQTEAGELGRGFLAEVCRDWEAACEPAAAAGIRIVKLRIGLVLAPHGGPLRQMLPVFRLGLGGRVGDGRQWMSWITLGDLVRIVEHVLADAEIRGAVNATAPQPVRNAEFTDTLARVLRRPAWLALPAFVLRAAFGEMAEEMLLTGTRVVPDRLEKRGFRFEHDTLEPALRALLR
jgi:uncharacterized protein (TIGR01777 family)